MNELITIYKKWFHEVYRRPDYASIVMEAAYLASAALITLLASLFYFTVHGIGEITLSTLLVSVAAGFFLADFIHFKRFAYRLELFFIILIIYISLLVILHDEPVNTFHLIWFTLVPIFFSIKRSIKNIFLLGIIIAIIISLLRGLTNSFTLLNDNNVFLQVLALIEFFGLTISLVLYWILILLEKNHIHAIHDHLTGLHNRHLLYHDLEYFICTYKKNNNKPFYLIFCDLDRFKEVNDLFGHETGDQVLSEIGKRLNSLMHKLNEYSDKKVLIYRFGGDEFIILIVGASDKTWASSVAKSIIDTLEKPYTLEHYRISIKASAGIIKSLDNHHTAEELVWFADITMFENKRIKRKKSPGKTKPLNTARWEKKFEIARALENQNFNDHFYLVFQPIYDATSLCIVGCEVLLRRSVSESDDINIEEFIMLTEAIGVIGIISEWVIETALEKYASWQKRWPSLGFSLNISPNLLHEYRFTRKIQKLTKNLGLKNLSYLEFEITETSPMVNSEYMSDGLKRIKTMGVSLALDDYGQGNTSFLDLQLGEFQKIKIDKAMLWGALNDQKQFKILKAAVDSARSLGMSVTMEGVETREHLAIAQRLNCDFLQGFLLSKPLQEKCFERLLTEQY